MSINYIFFMYKNVQFKGNLYTVTDLRNLQQLRSNITVRHSDGI